MNTQSNWISISEMARICGISRQTLIYYDKHDIFKPGYIDENGYRYYSLYQIPFLREITALKNEHVSLKEIIDNLHSRNLDNMLSLLTSAKTNIQSQIADLQIKLNDINTKINYYTCIREALLHNDTPYLTELPERNILFCKWETEHVDRREMHFSHMKLRRFCMQNNIPVAGGFGALLPYSSLLGGNYTKNAGAYINLSKEYIKKARTLPISSDMEIITIPANTCACITKYGMPYETDHLETLLGWIETNYYHIAGPALDECMLDTTFYTEEHQKDFCQIAIPICMTSPVPTDQLIK